MSTLAADDEIWMRLSVVAHLLHHASIEVWNRDGQLPPDMALRSFGLAVYLARAQVIELVPRDYQMLGDVAGDLDLEGQTVLQLLTAAEEHTRPLPMHRLDLADGRQLVVGLCDLVREARDLGL